MMLHLSTKELLDRVKADQLPEGLDLCVFDSEGNSGKEEQQKTTSDDWYWVDGGIGKHIESSQDVL